jgi:predicted DNA-binding transcriptional regulator AlpA
MPSTKPVAKDSQGAFTVKPAVERFLTVDEIAESIGVTAEWVRLEVKAGRLPEPMRFGHRTHRWPASAIAGWLDKLRGAP